MTPGPTDSGLDRRRGGFFRDFPQAELLDEALRDNANRTPVFFVGRVLQDMDPDLQSTGFALVRLGPQMERLFNVNGEIAAYFVPWPDFQRRSFNAIVQRTQQLAKDLQQRLLQQQRFTPSRRLALLISPDETVAKKVSEWQADSDASLMVVPLEMSPAIGPEVLRDLLVRELRLRLGSRDLYQEQNPVSGEDFFGRTSLLRDVQADILGDVNVAILGLRRSGKTSVLKELQRQLLPQDTIVAIADFQTLDNSSVDDLAHSIAANLLAQLKVAKENDKPVRIGSTQDQDCDGMTLSGLAQRINKVASSNRHFRIVIALDEVESAARVAETDPEAVRLLLAALRSPVQTQPNVSLVFSGVANRLFRSITLGPERKVENPMFRQVKSVYLRPFDEPETAALLRGLGRPMFLDWGDDAVSRVQELTGGHPFFVRDLASAVRTVKVGSADVTSTTHITDADVDAVRDAWTGEARQAWNGIVESLGIHYRAAADLLDNSLTETEVSDWVVGDPDADAAADDLVALGLLMRNGREVKFSAACRALRALAGSRVRSPDGVLGLEVPVQQLIQHEESHTLEFKSTARFNPMNDNAGKGDPRLELEILKTVAGFLNADGGSLVIGVNDARQVLGIADDLSLFGGSQDRFERWLQGDLLGGRIDLQLIQAKVRLEFPIVRGQIVCRVAVEPSPGDVAFVDNEKLFVRMGNQTREIVGAREITRFTKERDQQS